MSKNIVHCLAIGGLLSLGLQHASADTISTLFASNNGGSDGGAIYFDLQVGSLPVAITGLDLNTAATVALTLSIYTATGTAYGKETNFAAWTLATTGSGTGAGTDLPTAITLDGPLRLPANTSYGLALVLGNTAGHKYTGTGSGAPTAVYSDDHVSLTLGTALNVPFSGSVLSPRVWNGTLEYVAVPEPGTVGLCLAGLALVIFCHRLRRLSSRA